MHLNNDKCPNCGKLLLPDRYISVGNVDYCNSKCHEEYFYKEEQKKKRDFTIPFVR